jgi:hypothetical protein
MQNKTLKTGTRVVLDYEDGPSKRVFGIIIAEIEVSGRSDCYKVKDDIGYEVFWHNTRTQDAEVIESPLYQLLREEK